MKIQRGIVKYKDRDDYKCTYGITDDNRTYYFVDETDMNRLADGSRIASTELVEVIDDSVKPSHLGIIDEIGNEVIPFNNKTVKSINNDIILVEGSTPIDQSVLEAIALRNDPASATKLVSTPATIKSKINSVMSKDGRYVFNDQFSEATIIDLKGNNLVNGESYSFIAIDNTNGKIYMSKNTPESAIVQYSILPPQVQSDVTPNSDSNNIDVSNVDVSQSTVENAMTNTEDNSVYVAEGNAPVENNENVVNNEGLSALGTDVPTDASVGGIEDAISSISTTAVASSADAGVEIPDIPPVVPDDLIPKKDDNEEDITSENNNDEHSELESIVDTQEPAEKVVEEEFVPKTETVEEDEFVPKTETVEEDEFVPKTETMQSSEEENTPDDLENVEQVIEEEFVPKTDDIVEEEKSVEENITETKEDTIPDLDAAINKIAEQEIENSVQTEEVNEDIKSDDEQEEIKEDEVNTDDSKEDKFEEINDVINNIFENNPVEEEQVEEEQEEIKAEEKETVVEDTTSELDDSNELNNLDDTLEDIDFKLGDLDSMIGNDLDSDIFSNKKVTADRIDINDDYFDNYQVEDIVNPTDGNIMEDIAKSMTELMKQNKEQKMTLAKYKERLKVIDDSRKAVSDKAREQANLISSLSSKLRGLESDLARLEAEKQLLEGRVEDQSKVINSQTRELNSIRPQLAGKDELAKILKDAKALLGDEGKYNY